MFRPLSIRKPHFFYGRSRCACAHVRRPSLMINNTGPISSLLPIRFESECSSDVLNPSMWPLPNHMLILHRQLHCTMTMELSLLLLSLIASSSYFRFLFFKHSFLLPKELILIATNHDKCTCRDCMHMARLGWMFSLVDSQDRSLVNIYFVMNLIERSDF